MNIYDNIRNGVYEVKKEKEEVRLYTCSCGAGYLIYKKDIPSYCPDCGKPVKKHIEALINQNEEIKNKYHEDYNAAMERFKNDLFEYHGIEDNPKREKAYSLAWDHGHSSGLSEVACFMEDFVVWIS